MNSPRSTRAAVTILLLGTAKGGFALESADRKSWKLRGPFLLGARTHDLRADPRGGHTWLMSSTGGHLGPTIYRSTNAGRTWKEATLPPRFEKATPKTLKDPRKRASIGQSVKTNFWLEPGHASEPAVWYCGTSPQGLFRSEDNGDTWRGVDGWNRHPNWSAWINVGIDGTPDGPVLHSIQIDPRDARHMTVSCSSGGTFESHDQGASWKPLNQGVAADFQPNPDLEYGHDPHCMLMHPADPDRWYQQNHCGIHHLDRARGERWTRIGKRMPKAVGDIGFPIVAHPTDPDTVWVIPMDGRSIWPRTSPGGKPAVYVTRDGGKRWLRQDHGLPQQDAYWTVLRQAFCADPASSRARLYFGTTSGEVWGSGDGGAHWKSCAAHLPRIYSLRVASAP
jgi:photosystem II stability/assembly factor-like uncharacterized protein